jgi:hypothetical protein
MSMTAGSGRNKDSSERKSNDDALSKRGIERIPADFFLGDGFHYTNVKDALAQADRRDKEKLSGR